MTDVRAADLLRLLVLALPVAAISWTITHEELFREVHDYCVDRSQFGRERMPSASSSICSPANTASATTLRPRCCWRRGFTLLYDDWRGYLIAWLALVWVANHLISIYGRLRLGIRSERLEIGLKEAVSERAGVKKMEDRPNQRKAG